MIHIEEAILVEGKYDKNTLSQIVDAPIFETSGFGIMKNQEKLDFLRRVAETRGLIILTDSDGAGLLIRNTVKGQISKGRVLHAYIPDIPGKEKRKKKPGKAGLLGVEGISPNILLEALRKCGAHILGEEYPVPALSITAGDLYRLGLSGTTNSSELRNRVKKQYGLPANLGKKAFLDALNCLTTLDALEDFLK